MKELHRAAWLAANSKVRDKNYFLACLALRKDGVMVHSTNSTVAENPTPSAHAESRCLRKTGSEAILWVARVLKDRKTWAMAKPCRHCRSLILNKNVKRVYYTIGPNEYGIWNPGDQKNPAEDDDLGGKCSCK